jgi:hypothetical protein
MIFTKTLKTRNSEITDVTENISKIQRYMGISSPNINQSNNQPVINYFPAP